MSEEQKEYIKNNEFNIKVGGKGIIQQKIYKLQQENVYYKNILTEFEKWLETTLENEKFCYLSPHGEDRYRYDIFKKCLDKLQELKEGDK